MVDVSIKGYVRIGDVRVVHGFDKVYPTTGQRKLPIGKRRAGLKLQLTTVECRKVSSVIASRDELSIHQVITDAKNCDNHNYPHLPRFYTKQFIHVLK